MGSFNHPPTPLRVVPLLLVVLALLLWARGAAAGTPPEDKELKKLLKTLASGASATDRAAAAMAVAGYPARTPGAIPGLQHTLLDPDPTVRVAAVKALHAMDADVAEPLLADLVRKDTAPSVRELCLKWLDDQAVLADVARHDAEASLRIKALAKVKDQAVLAEIATGDQDATLRRLAVLRLDDPSRLLAIAREDKDPSVWQAAVARVKPAGLVELVHAGRPDLRAEALSRLPAPTAVELARTDPDPLVRADAVLFVQDPAVVAEIGRKDKDPSVRETVRLIAKANPTKDLEVSGFHCERNDYYGVSCQVQVANHGALAYTAFEYTLSGVATGVGTQQIGDVVAPGETKVLKFGSNFASQEAGTVQFRLVGARPTRTATSAPARP